jgi:hypothetical protein
LRSDLLAAVDKVPSSKTFPSPLTFGCLAVTAFLLVSSPVQSRERLSWTYAGYEKLAALFDSEDGPLYGEKENRRTYHLRFVIEGESLETWTEILEIIDTRRKDEPDTAQQWFERFREHGDETCSSEWTTIDEQATSIIFRRTAKNCQGFDDQDALYRVLYGKKNVFLIFATRKGDMDDVILEGYLTVLRSAEVRD